MNSQIEGFARGGIRQMFELWESGVRLSEDKGENPWSGLVQAIMTRFRTELKRSLSADRRMLDGVEVGWYLQILDEILTYTESRQLADPFRVLVWRVLLSGTLAEFGIVVESGSPFSADPLFRQISTQITEERIAEAKRLGPVWQTLDRPVMAHLLRLKQLLGLAAMVQPRLTNQCDVDKVDSWRPIWKLLPATGSQNTMPDHRPH